MTAHFLQPCLERPGATWGLHNLSTNQPLAGTLIRAFDRRARNEGLLRRDALPTDTAIVLAPCSAVHTWFMRFPIDVLFVSREGRVLAIRRNVHPWRIAVRFGAFAVVELAADVSASTTVGHVLGLVTVPATPQTAQVTT